MCSSDLCTLTSKISDHRFLCAISKAPNEYVVMQNRKNFCRRYFWVYGEKCEKFCRLGNISIYQLNIGPTEKFKKRKCSSWIEESITFFRKILALTVNELLAKY